MANDEKVKIDIDLDAQKLSQGVQESISRIEALEKQLKDLEKTGGNTGDTVSNKMKEMSAGFDILSNAGKKMTAMVTLPLVGFGVASIKTAGEFEMAMAEVSAISGATGRDLEKLTEHAKMLGRETFFSAKEASEGMKYFALAGYDTNQILQVMKPTLDMAVASGMDLGTACDIVSDNVTALGLEIEDTTMLIDKMAMTQSKSNTTIEMMGEALKYVAPVANTLGINTTDLSVAIGLLADNGIKAGSAGTVLRGGLTRLVKPTKQIQKTMDKYNIAIKKNEDGSVDLMGTVAVLKDKLGGLDKVTQAQALTTIFGKEALSGWSALMNTSTDRVKELTHEIENSNGKSAEMAEIMGDTFEGSVKAMKSAFEGVMITIGDFFIPILKNVVDGVTDVMRKFNEMDEGSQKLIVAIGGTIAVIGPLMMIVGGLGGAMMKVIPLISGIASGMGLTLTASTVLAGGLIALGVAFAGLLAWMGSSNEMISYLQTEFGAFGEFLSMLGEHIYGTFQLVFGNIGILIKTLAKSLMSLMKGDFKEAGNVWKDGWAEMENNTAKAMSNIRMETANATSFLREMSKAELDKLSGDYTGAMETIKTVTADNIGESADKFVNAFKDMDGKSIAVLRGTSDTMAMLLDGIYEGMDNEAMTKKFIANLESMQRGGALELDKINKDTDNFKKTIEMNFKEGANQMSSAGKEIYENLKNVSSRGIKSVSESMASDIKKMDADTVNALISMGGSWGQVFNGITDVGSMSAEDLAKAIEQNYTAMGMTSEEVMHAMEQDMQMYQNAQKIANMELTEDNKKMLDNMTGIYQNLSMTTKDNVAQISDAVMGTVDTMAIGSVDKLKGMGEGWARVFKGVKDDGSQSTEETRAIVTANLQAMLDEGLPIGQLFKDGMANYMGDLAEDTTNKAKETKDGVVEGLSGLPEGVAIEMSGLPPEVQKQLQDAGIVGADGALQVKQNIVDGVAGTGEEVKEQIDVATPVQEEVQQAVINADEANAIKQAITDALQGAPEEAQAQLQGIPGVVDGAIIAGTTSAQQAQQIKDAILQHIDGVSQGVQDKMAGVPGAVENATSQASAKANIHMPGVASAINQGTNVYGVINSNLGLGNVAMASQMSNMNNTATREGQNLGKSVDKGTKDMSKSAKTNFTQLEKQTKTSMSGMSKTARQEATNMYNGVKTSFAQMNSQGSASANSLKNNVINATAIMKNSAIRFWQEIRNEYSRTIHGKIEVTKTIKENKIVTTTTVNKEAPASLMAKAFAVDEAEIATRQMAVQSLSRIKDNDTISVREEKKKGKEEERRVDNTSKGNTYVTNNYTSPKASSLLELKKQAKRESRKLGTSLR